MKLLLVLLAITLFGVGVSACGGAGTDSGPGSQVSSKTAKADTSAAGAPSTTPAEHYLKGDEDDDDEAGNIGHSTHDNDADFDNDQKDKEKGYYDRDDKGVLSYGHVASATEAQALVALVKRYYAAAAAGDGATACSMIIGNIVKSIPEDYGSGAGPAYLRGGKTCTAVMARLFKHDHKQVAAPFQVTSVRVAGNEALVVLGSRAQPASYVTLEHKGGVWKLVELLGVTLP